VIRRMRLVLIVARPAVAVLLGSYAAIGLADAGRGEDPALLARVLVAVCGFLVFSVACNDIADERIDRVNLAGDRRRPLVAGTAGRREIQIIGATAAVLALLAGATLGWPVMLVLAGGLVVSAGYSVRPVRIADRGALAALLLPACYVAVPYLAGQFAVGPIRSAASLVTLAGLYISFIGRILLKDFRDVRGDALFGKRTFLVRHGRRWTCVFSAVCLGAGAALLLFSVPSPSVALVAGYIGGAAVTLGLLRMLAADRGHRRDEVVISTIAILGRGMLLLVLAHLEMRQAHWAAPRYDVMMAALALVVGGQAVVMFRHGPRTRYTVAVTGEKQLAPL